LDEEGLNPSPEPRDPDPTDPDPTDPDPVEPSELCANFTLDYAAEPATVMLLVDGSGSMYEPIGTTTRWELVQEALFDEENGLVTELAPSARFGLVLYSSYDGFFGGASSCPIFETRPPELNSAERLRHLFGRSTPLAEGDTPTGEALDATVDLLLADPGQGPRYLILITDGLPDTCAVPDPQEGEPEALAAARRAFESGIETFVVGISSDIAPEHLQQMANIAQGAPLDAIWGEDPPRSGRGQTRPRSYRE
jgi:hypothetical protein